MKRPAGSRILGLCGCVKQTRRDRQRSTQKATLREGGAWTETIHAEEKKEEIPTRVPAVAQCGRGETHVSTKGKETGHLFRRRLTDWTKKRPDADPIEKEVEFIVATSSEKGTPRFEGSKGARERNKACRKETNGGRKGRCVGEKKKDSTQGKQPGAGRGKTRTGTRVATRPVLDTQEGRQATKRSAHGA